MNLNSSSRWLPFVPPDAKDARSEWYALIEDDEVLAIEPIYETLKYYGYGSAYAYLGSMWAAIVESPDFELHYLRSQEFKWQCSVKSLLCIPTETWDELELQ